MLHKPVEKIVYGDDGKAAGIISVGEDGKPAYAKCGMIVGDPTYFPDKCTTSAKVVRCIAILSHPITPGQEASAQIILPQNQINRASDIYVFCVSAGHCVAAQGKYIAFVSTVATRDDFKTNLALAANEELKAGLKLLGKVDSYFFDVYDIREPKADGRADGCYISKGYDATSHFEQTTEDVMDMYRRIYGTELDLSKTMVNLEQDDD